tara:strand:+ start:10284 stop:10952 length:669 start_codon:yes stop_codon:yes gene_type:complete
MANINQLRNVVPPSLPVASSQYSQQYTDQYSNVLRLYFNQLSNLTAVISSVNSGLTIAHIGASDNTDQYATADDTPTIVKFNTLDSGLGFTLNADSSATAQYSGVYKIDYSLQYANTDNTAHDVDVWLRINNIDISGSTSKFTLPARKSAGVPSYLLAVSFVVFKLNAGDNIELYWATNKAYSTTGPVNGVYMEHKDTQTTPFNMPSIPSAIGAISFMSSLY